MNNIFLIFICFLATLLGLWGFKKVAPSYGLIDRPNHRSSHSVPTIRGGGLVFVTVWLIGCFVLTTNSEFSIGQFLELAVPGILITAIGFMDDLKSRSVIFRLSFQILAALIFVSVFKVDVLDFGWFQITNVWLVQFIAAFLILYMVNAYNFIDGIDGIAASGGFVFFSVAAVLLFNSATGTLDWMIFAIMAACLAGFLFWNKPPAKIFMGDVGSGFLGFMIAAGCLKAAAGSILPFAFWLFPTLPIVCDVGFTLFRRMIAGEVWYSAHRSHCYQKLHNELGWNALYIDLVFVVASLICTFIGFWGVKEGHDLLLLLGIILFVLGVIHSVTWRAAQIRTTTK